MQIFIRMILQDLSIVNRRNRLPPARGLGSPSFIGRKRVVMNLADAKICAYPQKLVLIRSGGMEMRPAGRRGAAQRLMPSGVLVERR